LGRAQRTVQVVTKGRRISTYANKVQASEFVHNEEKPKNFHIQPKNANQAHLLNAIEDYDLIVAFGPAGTGKTFVSCSKVAQLFNSTGLYDRIVLTRANVPTGNSLGHFPGDIREKLAPWLAPMTSVLKGCLGAGRFEMLLGRDMISMQPLETIRGQSFERTLILVDEAQNLNMEEIKAVTTRMGEGSKMILMGDPNQSDVDNGMALLKFTDMCSKFGVEVPVIQFTVEDIVRSDIVGQLVRMFAAGGKPKSADAPVKKPRASRSKAALLEKDKSTE
jgi:phosphate starvation-inducible PhoH-like protein